MKIPKIIGYSFLALFFIGVIYISVILADYYLLGNNFRSVDYIAPFLLQFCGLPSIILGAIGIYILLRNRTKAN